MVQLRYMLKCQQHIENNCLFCHLFVVAMSLAIYFYFCGLRLSISVRNKPTRTNVLEMVAKEVTAAGGSASVAQCDVEERVKKSTAWQDAAGKSLKSLYVTFWTWNFLILLVSTYLECSYQKYPKNVKQCFFETDPVQCPWELRNCPHHQVHDHP